MKSALKNDYKKYADTYLEENPYLPKLPESSIEWKGIVVNCPEYIEMYSDSFESDETGCPKGVIPIFYRSVIEKTLRGEQPNKLAVMHEVVSDEEFVVPLEKQISVNEHPKSEENFEEFITDPLLTSYEYGTINLLSFYQLPQRSGVYDLYVRYDAYESNTVRFAVEYHPYPENIYAGS